MNRMRNNLSNRILSATNLPIVVSSILLLVPPLQSRVCGQCYVAGDFHQHTAFTDGAWSFQYIMARNYQYGLDWWANSEHGGGYTRNGKVSGKDLGLTFFWDGYNPNPIIGTVVMESRHQKMWRWQSLRDTSFQCVLAARTIYPDKFILQGYEMNVPGHEHASMGLIAHQFGPGPDVLPLAEFEYKFDNSDADTTGGLAQGWIKSISSGHVRALEAIAWLKNNYPTNSYLIPAHVERQSKYLVQDLRDMNNAAPGICFGFESMPGHQKSPHRGTYKISGPSYGACTYGGTGYFTARINGVWDALLSEGRHWWLMASSDFQDTTDDFYPGSYLKTYTCVAEKGNPQAIIDGLRSGNIYVVQGDLIDSLSFRAGTAMMGQTELITGTSTVLTIRVHDPETGNHNVFSSYTNPVLDHIDVIAGHVTGRIQPGSPGYTVDSVTTTQVIARFDAVGGIKDSRGIVSIPWMDEGNGWKEMSLVVNNITDSMYFRLRGTNHGLGIPDETDSTGNPLPDTLTYPNNGAKAFADLWFYSNPVFVKQSGPGGIPGSFREMLNINVRPNPTSGLIRIENPDGINPLVCEIFDLAGRKILESSFHGPAGTMDLSNNPGNVYIMKISSGQSEKIIKIIKY